MQQAQKIDFVAIMMKPYVSTGVKTMKIMTQDKLQKMVRATHPASNCRTQVAVRQYQ